VTGRSVSHPGPPPSSLSYPNLAASAPVRIHIGQFLCAAAARPSGSTLVTSYYCRNA
jgi:hypothetical protein